ncbi:MAG: hypothetical protein ACLF0G_14680 [Candidatus Brocadiia bacterium]
MDKDWRAREMALEAAVVVFFLVALAGLAAGAEAYVASLRAVAAAAAVVFVGRFPARVLLDALEPPAEAPGAAAQGAEGNPAQEQSQ